MKLIIFLSAFFSFLFHADGLAEHHYFMDQNHVVLRFEMDKNELQHYNINNDCRKNKMYDICISNYLLDHGNLKLNGNDVLFEFEESAIYNDHIIFKFKSKKSYDNINEIQISNDSFYEVNPKFKNRIRIDLNRFQKSFLLTKTKKSIYLN
jgi:hypothetical protein